MNLTHRIIARINTILKQHNLSKELFLQKAEISAKTIHKFTQNKNNHLMLHNAISISRLLEIHQGCVLQYIFNYYANLHNYQLPPEPMLDTLRVNSLALPFADNIAQNILQTIVARFVHTMPADTDMDFYIQTFNALDTTPFIFFYHQYFDYIDIGTGKLNDAPTFTIN